MEKPWEMPEVLEIHNTEKNIQTKEIIPSYENVEINGEMVTCKRVDNMLKEYSNAFLTAEHYRKTATVNARQATEKEKISTSQDWMINYADPGDWIIHNPWDKDPYVFGDKNDSIKERQEKFNKKYEVIQWENNKFRAKWVIKAVQVTENIVFWTSWWETMAVKSWGWVADWGYGIAEESFINTYEKFDPQNEDEQEINRLKKEIQG